MIGACALAAGAGPGTVAAAAAAPTLAACEAGFETVLQAAPAAAPRLPAQAVWLSSRWLRWPAAAQTAAAPPGARYRLHHAQGGQIVALPGEAVRGADGALVLDPRSTALPAALQQRWRWVGAGPTLAVRPADQHRLRELHSSQLVLTLEDAQGRVLQATRTQTPGALDELYARAEQLADLGVTITRPGVRGSGDWRTHFRLWAPTAQAVHLCLHPDGRGPATALHAMQRDPATGAWALQLPGDLGQPGQATYTYLVDVVPAGGGLVRNRVTDPYSLSLNTDSQRSWIGRLDDPRWLPEGWAQTPRPNTVRHNTDLVIYELHLRDFSVRDATVPAAHRGTYVAFTHAQSAGMQHLRGLAQAGLTDVHLLPVFDLATVPEQGCTTPDETELAALPPDNEEQQARIAATAAQDCFNWGYDPLHFTAPEGSYATDASAGGTRILEFRQMVLALHRAGLRVGMDMVYNHTSASGQTAKSVLDRIVPGYYHRLNAQGGVETSTCCDNTATEHRMMAKLMIDSAVVWARDHRIDSMRFDLMGHQPREAMVRLQRAVNQAAGRPIHLLGEGWNFGEVKDGARFLQAAQRDLNGTGIATFSDRGRDAARGGGCCDGPAEVQQRQGWLNGQHYAPNPQAKAVGVGGRDELLRSADLVRAGLAGTLQNYRMQTYDGRVKRLAEIDYAGQGAGYASQPGEVVNYVENHDNPTLWDLNLLKLPPDTPREDRARVQVLGGALTAFSQGMAYFHAGVELLRSKNLDRNSYDSGDWFNRIDWTLQDNYFGGGLPPEREGEGLWPAARPLLARAAELKPTPTEMRFTRDAFLDLMRIRASTPLFRLRTAEEVQRRLTLLNTGPAQNPAVVVGHLNGRGLRGAGFAEVLYAINVAPETAELTLPTLRGRPLVLHPVHRSAQAADARPAAESRWSPDTATLRVPPRTALVFVRE
ncbi:alpha-1,6-glucosidase [beta proteobacterium AAP51]|nr:alpha-1,6-glucosidase [beta proteobacterium AAP51]